MRRILMTDQRLCRGYLPNSAMKAKLLITMITIPNAVEVLPELD